MEKKTYYQTMFHRRNLITEALLSFFFAFSSWPRMLFETITRTNMGQRYFSFSGAIVLTTVLALYPVFSGNGWHVLTPYEYGQEFDKAAFIRHYFIWYAYLAVFMYMAVQRRNEILNLPGEYDFARFSKSTGNIHPRFWAVEINGKPVNQQTIETLLEPGFFFIVGLVLWLLGQPLGTLLIVSSIFYSLSYVAAYKAGEDFILDKIDEKIASEDLVTSFMEGQELGNNRGFSFYGRRPADPETRRQVSTLLSPKEEIVEAL